MCSLPHTSQCLVSEALHCTNCGLYLREKAKHSSILGLQNGYGIWQSFPQASNLSRRLAYSENYQPVYCLHIELAGMMVGKSDKTIRNWRAQFFENGDEITET